MVREISPNNWQTQIITNDTFYYSITYFDFDIDNNGDVHFVYSLGRKIYYTNNIGGSFKTPLRIDSLYIVGTFDALNTFPVKVNVTPQGKVYIVSLVNSNQYSYYYGSYTSGFTKSTWRIFTNQNKMPPNETDGDGNLYIFSIAPTYVSGTQVYYIWKFNDNNRIYQKNFLTFPNYYNRGFSIQTLKDNNNKVHCIASAADEEIIYYANSLNEFNSNVVFNINQSTKFIYSASYLSSENKIYFTFETGPVNLGKLTPFTTDVSDDRAAFPDNFVLHQNYPNPFNPITKIKYELPIRSKVSLNIYDILGKKVKTLENEVKNPGYYEIEFDASKLPSGVYFYKLEAGDFSSVKKMVLIK